MQCLSYLLFYVLVIPIPSASPLLLLLYVAALYWTINPCGYCITLATLLFVTTSPSSPFLANDTNDPKTGSSALTFTLPGLPLSSPLPDRTWTSLNFGRIFDPVLVGYREIATYGVERNETVGADVNADPGANAVTAIRSGGRSDDTSEAAGAAVFEEEEGQKSWTRMTRMVLRRATSLSRADVAKGMRHLLRTAWARLAVVLRLSPGDIDLGTSPAPTSSSISTPSFSSPAANPGSISPNPLSSSLHLTSPPLPLPLPRHFLDLRLLGLGFVLDLNPSRTEEGMAWEVAEWKRAVDLEKEDARARAERWARTELDEGRERSGVDPTEEGGAAVHVSREEDVGQGARHGDIDRDGHARHGFFQRIPLVSGLW